MKLFRSTLQGNGRRAVLRLSTLTLLAAALLLAPIAQAQTGLAGYWVLHVPNGDGTSRDTFFQFVGTGEAITGILFGRANGTPIGGTLTDGKLHFETLPATTASGARVRPTVYDGSYLNGKLTLHTEAQEGVAERTTREASIPPTALPLPPLHDLPDNGLVRSPPMGWNSWNKFAGKVDDAAVRAMADAMVATGMNKLGYVYINIDDTWEGGRDAAGNILSNRKFPDMKALADYVHAKGLKIGIYSSPGPKTCAGYEASFGHETQDARTYAAWGIDYLKYDFCSARGIYQTNQEEEQALYQKMGEALQKTGRPIVYSLCQYGQADVWKWGTKTGGNLWRTTGDIRDEWASMDRIGFSQLDISSYTRPGHWNDPDMLEIGNGGMSLDEYRTHMSLWSLLAAPLIAGNDLRTMSEGTKSILMNAEMIAVDQDAAALPVQRLSQQGKIEVLSRPMKNGSVVVGIFNRGSGPAEGSVSWTALKLAASPDKLKARDLWKHEPVPVTGDTYTATVPPHGVVVLQINPTK